MGAGVGAMGGAVAKARSRLQTARMAPIATRAPIRVEGSPTSPSFREAAAFGAIEPTHRTTNSFSHRVRCQALGVRESGAH